MILAVVAALALGAAPDPCAPVEPEPTRDVAAAAEYRAVGDSERSAGSRDTAAAAYRAALAHDPGDAKSRAALAAVCEETRRASAFERGVRLREAGDRRGAIAAFEEARAGGHDRSAALLEGISLYELGDDDKRADMLLSEAEEDPDHRDAARFFRGLVALRAGRSDDAAALLEASAADRHLGPMALDLARLARREGRLVLSVLFESGWNSNVDLTPDGTPRGPTQDGSAGVTAVARFAPFGDSGPFVRAMGHYRDQFQYDPLDIGGAGGAVGWQAGRGRDYLLAEAGYEYRSLGGAPYLSAPRLLGSGRLAFSDSASVGALYFARWETFTDRQPTVTGSPQDDTGYSGLHHFGELDLTWAIGRRSTATVAWQAGRDATREVSLSWWETGPRGAVRLQLGRNVRLGLDAAFTVRRYDAEDPAFAVVRSDSYMDAAALLEVDLSDRWTLRLSGTGRKAFSNVPDFEYTQIVPMIGVVYTVGLL